MFCFRSGHEILKSIAILMHAVKILFQCFADRGAILVFPTQLINLIFLKMYSPTPQKQKWYRWCNFFFTDITWWQILSPLHILSPASIYAGTLKINAKILFLPTLACKHVISCNQNIVRLLDFDPGLISIRKPRSKK